MSEATTNAKSNAAFLAIVKKAEKYSHLNEKEMNATADSFMEESKKLQQSACERMILEGAICISFCRFYGNKDGQAKYAERAVQRGLKRIPDAKYQQTAIRLAWLAMQGIDTTVFSREEHFKPFARRTVKLSKNGQCSWAMMQDETGAETDESVETVVCKLAEEAGYEHEGKVLHVDDCIGNVITTLFGGKPSTVAPFAVRWSFSPFKGKSKKLVRAAMLKWWKNMIDDKGTKETATILAEVISKNMPKTVPTIPVPTPNKQEAESALQGVA